MIGRLVQRVQALERTRGGQAVPAPRPNQPPAPVYSPPTTRPGSRLGPSGRPVGSIPCFSIDWISIDWIDWENLLGRNWFAIVGAVALAIGVGFFLKLAIDNDWIGEIDRILVASGAGLALIGAGWYFQGKYPLWAKPVTGAGITILYLTIYAAFSLYDLIGVVPALLLLSVIVVFGVVVALRLESLMIALLGIVGAFLAPILLGAVIGPDLVEADLPDEHWLLLYILLVGAGVLAVSTFRNWQWLVGVGMLGSYAVMALWAEGFPDRNLVLAQLALSGVLLEFIGATTLFHVIWRRASSPIDLGLMTLNAAVFFLLTVVEMGEQYEDWFGLIAFGMSLLYGLVALAAFWRTKTLENVSLFALSISVVFLTIALPLQLTGNWIAVAWATEGAVVAALGLYLKNEIIRAFALGILATAVIRLLVFDTQVELDGFTPVFNERFPTFVVSIGAFYAAAFMFWRKRTELREWEAGVYQSLIVAANFITLWLVSAEAIAYFDSRDAAVDTANKNINMTLTALWALYAAGLMVVALAQRSLALRWGSLALLSAAVAKLLLVDTFVLETDYSAFRLVINFGFLTFVFVLASVLFAAYAYWKQREQLEERERFIYPALLILGNVVALWVFSAETVRFFDARAFNEGVDTYSQMQLTLTILWAIYAVGLVGVGISRRSARLRQGGIGLLAILVVKLFAHDAFLLERGYRVAAFVTLGGLLLAVGLTYQRYSQAVRGFLFGKPA